KLDRAARRQDQARCREAQEAEPREEAEEEPAPSIEGPEPFDPLEEREPISRDEYDVTRRQFFNRTILGVFGIFLAQFGLASLAFLWPKLKGGGFGGKVNVGKVEDIKSQVVLPDGRVQPLFFSAARAYVVPFRGEVEGSSFEGLPVIADGLSALWQRCVHLGCRVPTCQSSQGFECPCHGSKYNYHGEYEDGPAPRNLDRFAVSTNDAGELIIDTGTIIQTARSRVKTAVYPQGSPCITIALRE
ncbi:MAG: ubiquinol-cytochrome c reductase iron-sulfur subunit, partial [Acidimicrobiia bacterium]